MSRKKEPTIRVIKLNEPTTQAIENYYNIIIKSFKENLITQPTIKETVGG